MSRTRAWHIKREISNRRALKRWEQAQALRRNSLTLKRLESKVIGG